MTKLSLLIIAYALGILSDLPTDNTIPKAMPQNFVNEFQKNDNFEVFLKEFLSKTYSEKKFDSLVYVSSPVVMRFTHKKLGFGRFWNMGVYCNLYKGRSYAKSLTNLI